MTHMPLPHDKTPARPTLDDLLRLKRNERPGTEFWGEFERGLREKQLAALVRQPRGWERLRPVFVRAFRWSVPATAAAVATFGVVRHFSTVPASIIAQQPGAAETARVPGVRDDDLHPTLSTSADPVQVASLDRRSETFPDQRTSTDAGETRTSTGNDSITPLAVIPAREAASYVSLRPANLPRPAATSGFRTQPASNSLGGTDGFVPVAFAPSATLDGETMRPAARPAATEGPVGSWQDLDARAFMVSALDLRVTTEHAANLPSVPANYSPQNRSRVRLPEDEDRELRDLGSRFGVQGSSLTIRF